LAGLWPGPDFLSRRPTAIAGKRHTELGVSASAAFSATHTFARSGHLHHDTIVVTPRDDQGVAGAPLTFDVIV